MTERLTERIEKYIEAYQLPPFGIEVDGTVELLQEVSNKLDEYENLEEQGLLLRLPCKVGTKVYAINPIIDYGEVGDESIYYYSIIEREFQIYMMMDSGKLVFGRNVFLTKAEAEQKLKEMESD